MPRKNNKRKPKIRRRSRGRLSPPRSLFTQTGIQWVRLGGNFFQDSDSGGNCAGVLVSDPTIMTQGFPHPEYAAWQSLFGEIKVVSMTVNFLPNFPETKSSITSGSPMAIAGSTNVTSAPASYAVVLDNASSTAWNILNDTSPRGFSYTMTWKDLLWASASSPGSLTSQGTPGGIGFYGQGYAALTPIVFIRYSAVYMMRNRI